MRCSILFFFFTLFFSLPVYSSIYVGIGKSNITPPIGTPSAGFGARRGAPMQSVHDPLFATALFICTEDKKIVLCSVDHLGFPYTMYQKVLQKLHQEPLLQDCEIFIGSTHTHSGGGAYCDTHVIGYFLAGKYNKKIADFYIEETANAILKATKNLQKAKIGIEYGLAEPIIFCRSNSTSPLYDIALMKITSLDDLPIAAVFNFAAHPSILKGDNLAFSADFIGFTRAYLQEFIYQNIESLYFNGAQAEVKALLFGKNGFESCAIFGQSLAKSIETLWHKTTTSEDLEITTQKHKYSFYPTPYLLNGSLCLPVFEMCNSEVNLIVFNKRDAFITIPGELSCTYDKYLKEVGKNLQYKHVSILGLTNDAHGYIITPKSWDEHVYESSVSFGGKMYGERIASWAKLLLESSSPYSK